MLSSRRDGEHLCVHAACFWGLGTISIQYPPAFTCRGSTQHTSMHPRTSRVDVRCDGSFPTCPNACFAPPNRKSQQDSATLEGLARACSAGTSTRSRCRLSAAKSTNGEATYNPAASCPPPGPGTIRERRTLAQTAYRDACPVPIALPITPTCAKKNKKKNQLREMDECPLPPASWLPLP